MKNHNEAIPQMQDPRLCRDVRDHIMREQLQQKKQIQEPTGTFRLQERCV